jgi:hypothetical protein
MKFIIQVLIFFHFFISGKDEPVIKLKGKPDIFTVDKLDNLYIYQGNLLEKYNPEGKKTAHFSSVEFGPAASIDATDPMQTILFFKEFNVFLVLDKNLNQIGKPVYLDKIGFPSIDAVCKSKQFGIWLFDNYEQRIILYGFNPKGILNEINLLKHTKTAGSIDFMIESGNELYLHQKNHAVLVYDQLGGRLSIHDLGEIKNFQVRNGNIVFTDRKFLMRYNPEKETRDTIQLNSVHDFEDIRLGNQKIFVLKGDSIRILPLEDF